MKICVIERLNNGKTQANISSQKQNKITSYMRHTSPANPTAMEEPNFILAPIADPTFAVKLFGCDSELKFVLLTTKLTLNNSSSMILGAAEDRCHKLGPRLITYAIPLYAHSG